MAQYLGLFLCRNLSCILFGAHFLGIFLCSNLSCTLFDARSFGARFLQKPIWHTLVHVSWACSFATHSLLHSVLHVLRHFLCTILSCTLLGARFSGSFFATTSYTLFVVRFIGRLTLQQPRLHTDLHVVGFFLSNNLSHLLLMACILSVFLNNKLSCTLFSERSFASFFAKTSLAHFGARFMGVFLYNKHCLLHDFRGFHCNNLSCTLVHIF